MHYFISSHKNLKSFSFSQEIQHQIKHVLKLKAQEQIGVIFKGAHYLCKVNYGTNEEIFASIIGKQKNNNEAKSNIILMAGLLKKDKWRFVLQKATELRVKTLIPVQWQRTVVHLKPEQYQAKMQHWNKIITEATEQSHRNELMRLEKPYNIKEVIAFLKQQTKPHTYCFMLDPHAKKPLVLPVHHYQDATFIIAIGSEGGFNQEEKQILLQAGFQAYQCGPCIMRAETASIYMASIINFWESSK